MNAINPLIPTDPLAALSAPERVNYATGVMLDATDFQDEQTYHRARLAAALRHLAGYGTLAGLRVTPPAAADADQQLRVEPGLAIDRLGRLMQIDTAQCLSLTRWLAAASTADLRAATQRSPRVTVTAAVVADVFLSAGVCARGKTPAFASGPFDALDAVIPARLAESPSLELVMRQEQAPAPIPAPANLWPAPTVARDVLLQNVLASWDGQAAVAGGQLDPLPEHVTGHDTSAIFLARVTIPVTLDAAAPPTTRPVRDMATRVSADNSARPFIVMSGKWSGRALTLTPLVQP
jgi:hypothetical protein